MNLDPELCTQCGICATNCPLDAINKVENEYPVFTDQCVTCGLCKNSCPTGAISFLPEPLDDELTCDHCPIGCRIKESFTGACKRYKREGGAIVRITPLVVPPPPSLEAIRERMRISYPVTTGIGAGTTYPDYVPAPYAAVEKRDGVDVVTVVTEAPLTYSSVMVKVDTERSIGDETSSVRHKGSVVGHVTTELYGSKMISIGGINCMKGKNKVDVTRLMVDILNLGPFELKVDNGATLLLQVGKPPIIDGEKSLAMKVACGAAIIGMLGPRLKGLADELIVLDADITGLFTETHTGKLLGYTPSGIKPPGTLATRGRYFGESGRGWGGTKVREPKDAIASFDKDNVFPGMRVIVLEVTVMQIAMLEANEQNKFHEVAVPEEVQEIRQWIWENREPSSVSALYVAGAGGSARRGVTTLPLALTSAVHEGRVAVSVGGVQTYVLPGGGINFMVDVAPIPWRPFTWVPAPAVVTPLEFTMEKETYIQLGGHQQNLTLLSQLPADRIAKR